MKKILLGFFFLGLISLLFCLKPISANAVSNFVVASVFVCYNSRTLVPNPNKPGAYCYSGNWRFNTRVRNDGDSSNANEPGVVNPDEDFGIHDIVPLGSIDYNIILASGEYRDFYHTITGWICDWFEVGTQGSWVSGYNSTGMVNIDSVGPCPTAAPTVTPTPISCPLAIQSMSFLGSGTSLINDYNTTQYKGSPQYTVVNSTKTGKVTKTEIYGTLDRDIPKGGKVLQCKITDSTGTTTLGESNTNNGAFTKGVSWMGVSFPTPVNIVNGTSYRLYCKVNNVYGGGSIYWLDNCWKRIDKAYRLYMCN